MKRVMVFGAFDGLHPGHIDFFKQAKNYGDYLIVSVGTDKNVQNFKGKKPLFSQEERLEIIKNLKIVDRTVLGADGDFYKEIKKYNPDVICLGYDQWATEDEVKRQLASVGLSFARIVRLKPYQPERSKSTHLKNRSVDF